MKHFYQNKCVIFFLTISCSWNSAIAQSQWPLFGVYDVHGDVELLKQGKNKISLVKKNQFIFQGESLLLSDDKSEIILFDKDANYITLNKKNSYSTDAILKLKKGHLNEGTTAKYFSFLWEEFFKPVSSEKIANREDISNSSGGVSRGIMQVISPSLNYQTSIDECLFRWRKLKDARSYSFSITGTDGKEYFHRIIRDTQLLVKLHDSLTYGNSYNWSISNYGSSTQESETVIGQIELIDEDKVLPTLQLKISDSLGGLVHDLQLVNMYEENGCTKKAYSIYKELLIEYPGDNALKKLFHAFIRENYIVEEHLKK